MKLIALLVLTALICNGLTKDLIQRASSSSSCQDRCEEIYDAEKECHCDEKCGSFGNCCEDFIPICASTNSCNLRCAAIFNASLPCQCHSECSTLGNCCEDFGTACIASCADRCMEANAPSNSVCRCEADCQEFDSCCSDFVDVCLDTSSGSCQDRCGESYNPDNDCHCTDDCRKYGNCCDDFLPICASNDSCVNRCGENFDATLPCHCNSRCPEFGNCCSDFESTCIASCEGRCLETDNPTNSVCRCDGNCQQYGNCCEDINDFCYEEKYLCKGNCTGIRFRCSCESGCVENKTCCSDYQETCLNEIPWEKEDCANVEDMECPAGFEVPPVILFSIDGYRSEYIYRHLTPNIWKLASCGVHAPYMRAIYPTKTFPNHYTIATGLYPESHGIIDNTIYDHEIKEEFRLGSPESFNPAWWGGEPIWVTTSNQNKISACYFWPGSDVNITRYPDYYYKFDDSVDNEERMYQALEWLDLPPEKRPSFMTLYISIVDSAGHNSGPVSSEVDNALVEADRIIDILMNGLKLRNLENCVNLIMLADHGMAPISCDRKSSLEDYGVDLDSVYARTGAFGRVGKSTDPALWDQFDAEKTHNQLRCSHSESHWLSFLKDRYLPKRHHYAYNDRIEPIHIKMDDEWIVEGRKNSNNNCNGGTHGFDNEYRSMHSLFTAHGPGFKRKFNTTEPFEAIEVYNLMTDLLSLDPAPNNGTKGSLYNIMSSPANAPPEVARNLNQCPPTGGPVADDSCSDCLGITDEELQNQLNLDVNEEDASLEKHLPYSVDFTQSSSCKVVQHDYVNLFDRTRKLPVFVSFTLDRKSFDLFAPPGCVRPDPRIRGTAKCSDYSMTNGVSPVPLFPAELLNGNSVFDAMITSNVVPMYPATQRVWNYMARSLAGWTNTYGGIHAIAGPIYDHNFDGLPDTDDMLREMGKYLNNDTSSTPIPTHFFLIALRCLDGTDLADCKDSADSHDVLTFIIPNYEVEPCHEADQADSEWIPKTVVEHIARVKDVEILTGTRLFVGFGLGDSTIRFRLRLPQFSSPWVYDFLYNPPPTSTVTTTAVIVTTNSSSKLTSNFVIQMLAAFVWSFILSKV